MSRAGRSPARSSNPVVQVYPDPEVPKDSAFVRYLVAPLSFLSFLLSLALVDSRNHSLRRHHHAPARPQPTTPLGRVRASLHCLIFKPVEDSPYSYVRLPDSPASAEVDEKSRAREPWHWHTKQRKMMRAEFEDAFRVGKWMLVFLGCLGTMMVISLGVLLNWSVWYLRNWSATGASGEPPMGRGEL